MVSIKKPATCESVDTGADLCKAFPTQQIFGVGKNVKKPKPQIFFQHGITRQNWIRASSSMNLKKVLLAEGVCQDGIFVIHRAE